MEKLVVSHEEIAMILMEQGFGLNSILEERDEQDFVTVRSQQSFSHENNQTVLRGAVQEEQSIHTLVTDIMDGVTQLRLLTSDFYSSREQMQEENLAEQTTTLLNIKKFEEFTDWCRQATDRLSILSSSRDLLLYYLQQPPTPSCLTMHRRHHGELEQLLRGLSDMISSTCLNMRLLQQCRHSSLQPSLDGCVATLSRLHGSLRTTLCDIRSLQHIESRSTDT